MMLSNVCFELKGNIKLVISKLALVGVSSAFGRVTALGSQPSPHIIPKID